MQFVQQLQNALKSLAVGTDFEFQSRSLRVLLILPTTAVFYDGLGKQLVGIVWKPKVMAVTLLDNATKLYSDCQSCASPSGVDFHAWVFINPSNYICVGRLSYRSPSSLTAVHWFVHAWQYHR